VWGPHSLHTAEATGPDVGEDFVRVTQTAGGRPGMPAPRRVRAGCS
jgi:hypothetical protein